jgi:hypothetical protein
MLNKLEFDNENHIYRLDGVAIPGYSQIAKKMGIANLDNIPEYTLEQARQFGQAGHYATRLSDEGRLDEDSLSLPLIPCLKSYRDFLRCSNVEIIKEYIEKPICSFRYRFGTTPDRICLIRGELSVLELKFQETISKATSIQTAFQKIAANEFYHIKIKKRYGLQITLNGNCILHSYKDKNDEQVALCFLGAFNWREKNAK